MDAGPADPGNHSEDTMYNVSLWRDGHRVRSVLVKTKREAQKLARVWRKDCECDRALNRVTVRRGTIVPF